MTANTSPIFPASPSVWQRAVSTSNPARDGMGSLYTLVDTTTNGARVDHILASALGATRAGVLRFFINGLRVLEVAVPATSPAETQAAWYHEIDGPGDDPLFVLGPDDVLAVTAHFVDAGGFHITASGGLY